MMQTRMRKYYTLFYKALLLPLAVLLGHVITNGGILTVAGLAGLLIAAWLLLHVYKSPREGVFLSLILSFFVIGLTRYIPDGPLGLSIDIILLLTLIVSVFSSKPANTKNVNSDVFWLSVIWFLYTLMELFNPEARSKEAWFYAVRGVSLYQLFVVVLVLMYFRELKDVRRFINIVIVIMVVATFYGARQLFFGLDAAENAWLRAGAYKTHLLRGVLRVFSFFSDAGQFGATCGYAGIAGIVLAAGPFKRKIKIGYLVAGIICLWGMMLSGTRGALVVPLIGAVGYLVATRKIKAMIIGFIIVGAFYSFLKFTLILNDNNQVRRLRSALNPNDPSLLVRKENQKKFKAYLATRPIGGGIGTSGSWGIRFTPGTFLAVTANDSWYVKIWAETGIAGLSLHLFVIFFLIFKGYIVIFSLHDDRLRAYMMALHAGFMGIAAAAYGNPILGQFPLNIMLYTTWALYIVAPQIDQQREDANAKA